MLDRLPSVLSQQRSFFSTGQTQEIEFRLSQLRRLQQMIRERQDDILQALQADLHKPAYEAVMTELVVLQEIEHTLKHLRRWAKPKSVPATLIQMPARGKIYPEPLGVVLIIGAWNYPFYLSIAPLIAAIAAGNCAIVKPSELAPHTSRIVAELIEKTFDPAYVTVIEGGIETSQALLAEKFDHIFFTGSPAVGKVVMTAAAQHLT
ncbi:MAG TPA: aldehyde dehydrogenase family protein, partial [Allocoleopsis sp.]